MERDSSVPVNGTFVVPVLPPGSAWVDIQSTFGSVYIGLIVSVMLTGVTAVQAWHYSTTFPKDVLWMKLMVILLCVLEYVRAAFGAHMVYYYVVLNWGNPIGLETIVWSLKTLTFLTHFELLVGHLYFAWRIFMLSRTGSHRIPWTAFILTMALWNYGLGLAASVNVATETTVAGYISGPQTILTPFTFGTAVATNISITGSIIFLLSRNRSGYSRTNRIINTIILYLVEAGAITLVADVLCLSFNQYISKLGFAFIGVYLPLGNLYANSLMTSLNARTALDKMRGDGIMTSLHIDLQQSQSSSVTSRPVHLSSGESGLVTSGAMVEGRTDSMHTQSILHVYSTMKGTEEDLIC